MKKGIAMFLAAAMAAMCAQADTWTDPDTGITWSYQVNGDEAEICKIVYDYYQVAVSPAPTGHVTIPSTLGGKPVTCIGAKAFYDCREFTSVLIPDSVTSIGGWAFRDCRGLASVKIPNSVTNIGDAAFYECTSLTSVTIGSGVTNIGGSAFNYCSRLVDVTIPDSVTSIGYGAFSETPFYDSQPNGLVVFGRVAYKMKGNCPRSVVIPDGVASIGDDAFYGCYGLASVAMPDSLTSVGDFAFFGCENLTDVTIPDSVTRIGECAFEWSGLTSVTIPNSVTNIGTMAFSGCRGLADADGFVVVQDVLYDYVGSNREVTIPDGVSFIDDESFYDCGGLTSVTIPDSVTSIGEDAFEDCSGLTRIMVDASNPYFSSANGLLLSKDGKKLILGVNGDVVIPDGVANIENLAFSDCYGLTSVTIPGSVKDIGTMAFYGCGNLKSVMFAGAAPNIGSWAFEDVGDGCTMYVRKGSTGWGVDIPGTWDGVRIEYFDGLTEKCTVTFDVNGNGMLSHHEENPRTVVKNAAVGELPTPMVPNLADSGFGEFLGWFTAKTGGAQISADTIVTKDVTYYAHWKYFRYVVLDANGGELPDEYWWPFIENGAPVDSLPDASRPGYTFDGWYTAASGGTRVSAATKITATVSNIREPLKYYAHWKEVVSFPGIATWKFYEEADDDEGLNLAAWEDWSAVDVPFWIGEGICMAIPVEGNFTADDVALVAGTYSDYGRPRVVSDEWMFAKHCTALEKAVGYDPYEDDEFDQGAYGLVFEDDVKDRNYSLSMDIWPQKKVVSGRKWILLEMGGRPTRGCKTFYLGLKGRDDVGYSRFRIYATPDQGVSQSPSNWSSQMELAVLPMPIGGGTTSGSGMYANGTQVSLSANPNAGYEFDGWYDQSNGQLLGTSVSIAYVTTRGDKTVFAKFRQKSAPTPTPEPTPDSEEPPVLFESVDGVAPLAAASEYDGCLYDVNGVVAGTIQVKVGKPNKNTGLASVKATLQLAGQKKLTLKAVEKGKAQIASDGPTTAVLAGGEPCEVTLGAEGLSGFYGAYAIDGSRNFFTSKDKSEANAANDVIAQWIGVVNVVWDGGVASVSIAKKGKVKASVTLANGTKATANTQLLIGDEWLCVPVIVTKKANIAFTLWLPLDSGAVVVEGLPDGADAGKAGALKSGAAFKFDASALAAALGDATYAAQLPDGLSVEQDGKKWVVAGGAKAGKVQLAKGAASPADIDEAKAGANPSALKLTYKAKDGTFKGMFKAYTLVKGKPKATTVNVSGILVGDKGYGTLSVRKTSVSAPVEIR